MFVPPPPEYVEPLMADLEGFLHDAKERTPTLIKAALAHAQFETVHPFLDGNGRLGRLLITLLLCAEGVLTEPTLYLSLYFKRFRSDYYEALQRTRTEGDWEGWLEFFLQGVFDTAQQAFGTAQRLIALFEADRERTGALGRSAGSALQVLGVAQRRVVFTASEASQALHLSPPTVRKSIEELEKLGILREMTGKERHRVWFYSDYLSILSEGAEAQ